MVISMGRNFITARSRPNEEETLVPFDKTTNALAQTAHGWLFGMTGPRLKRGFCGAMLSAPPLLFRPEPSDHRPDKEIDNGP
jgi:hypothetical protein